jgi:hypothetical protein
MVTPEFTISLADLKAVLKQLKLVMKSVKKADVLITYDGTNLNIGTQGFDTSITGQGYWPGSAHVDLGSFLPLIKVPPQDDPVTLKYKDDRFWIQSFSLPAMWQHILPVTVDLPLDAGPKDILRLRFKYSEEDIEKAGLLPRLEELEKAVSVKITAAARMLSQYGITPVDIKRVYEDVMKKGQGLP